METFFIAKKFVFDTINSSLRTRSKNVQDQNEKPLRWVDGKIFSFGINVPGWCEEVVTGTAETMRFLASFAKSKTVIASLLGIISALEARCLRCCATGEFWKTCVAPIVEKWKFWNDKNKRELQNSGSVDFRVLLSRFSVFFQGVISTLRILPPEKKRKIGQNNPENRRTLSFATPS